jgi:hypothetical protein
MSDPSSGGEIVIDAYLRMQHAGMDVVGPVMEEGWRHYLGLDDDLSAHSSFRFHLPSSSYGIGSVSGKPDPAGPAPLQQVRDHLDANRIERAVLNPGTAERISGFAYADASIAIARATNDWLVQEWLRHDDRLFGSIVVSPRDPAAAAAEIDRFGADPRIVSVSLAYPQDLLGHRRYQPIFEAAAAHRMALNLDAGGGFVGINRGYTGSGHPSSRYEYRVASLLSAQMHLVSLIAEGWFDRLSRLRLTVTGSSVTWLPAVLATMDAQYRRGDMDARLRRLPSEYLGEFIRFTTSDPDWDGTTQAVELLATIPAGNVLMFGSGTPFRPTSAPATVLDRVPAAWRSRVGWRNAAAHYVLPIKAKPTEAKASARV